MWWTGKNIKYLLPPMTKREYLDKIFGFTEIIKLQKNGAFINEWLTEKEEILKKNSYNYSKRKSDAKKHRK